MSKLKIHFTNIWYFKSSLLISYQIVIRILSKINKIFARNPFTVLYQWLISHFGATKTCKMKIHNAHCATWFYENVIDLNDVFYRTLTVVSRYLNIMHMILYMHVTTSNFLRHCINICFAIYFKVLLNMTIHV